MTRICWSVVLLLLGAAPTFAQLDGPASTGVSASLIRLFGTNNAFTAQMEVQVLGPDGKERFGTPMGITLLENRIRVEVDMTRMRNREQPDAIAQVKPFGMDSVVSIIHPEKRTTLILFPKLHAFVKLNMPPAESEAFLKRSRIERTTLGKEKMEGHPCLKQRVVFTEDGGKKSEATVWTATDLRDFPVCVATKEKEGAVAIRFRQIQFTRAESGRFEVPAGYLECADMQVLMAGPGKKYMKDNGLALKSVPQTSPVSAKPKNAPAPKKK